MFEKSNKANWHAKNYSNALKKLTTHGHKIDDSVRVEIIIKDTRNKMD